MKTTGTFVQLCLFLGLGVFAWGQATSQIQGIVRDASGATVPGAEVKATQTDTGASRTVSSGADGGYVLSNLPIGPYRLEATKEGFATYVQTGIVLQVAVSPTIDIALKLGAVSEQVQVEANASLVETQSTSIGSVIENQRILELPLNGRNAADLIQLAGAAVPQGTSSSRSMQGGQAISVAGGQSFGVTYLLDGATHNNPYDNLNLPLPFPDSLQEFKVETGALNAASGGHSAAAINSVTKSGTNDYHGDVFWFLRNGAVNARNFFATRNDSLKRNQFGGTVGGPIMKNKLFFFAGYQGTRTRQDPTDQITFVPTEQMLTGDFTTIASAQCNASGAIALKTPASFGPNRFVNNRIDPAFLSPAAVEITRRVGTSPDPCGRVNFGPRTSVNDYQLVGRTDYQVSDKQTIFGRYMATTYFQTTPNSFEGSSLLATIQGGRDNLAQSATFGDTYLVSPTTVNSFRAAFNRTAIHRTSVDFFSFPDVGVNMFSYMPHYSIMRITGAFGLGGGTENNATFRTTTYQINDDVNMVRGSHQIAFGINISQWRSKSLANVRSPGSLSFNGSATGLGLADFLAGFLSGPNAFLQSSPNTLESRQNYFALYAQDTWKATSRLTINYGVRWEPFLPQTITNGAIYTFDFGRFNQGVRSTVFTKAPVGFLFPGDKGFVRESGMERRPWNFAPRVGLAWDPRGDGKMSIRASYGLSYDYVNAQFYINASNAPPWGSEIRIPGPISFDDPFSNSAGISNIFPITFDANAPFSPFGPFAALKPDQQTTQLHSWNLSIQRQLTPAWFVSANYVGSETVHLWLTTQGNPGTIVPSSLPLGTCPPGVVTGCNATTNLNQRRVLYLQNPAEGQYIGYMDQFDDGGTQQYHGLILSVQRRLSRGVSANFNYTWSHCIGDPVNNSGGSTGNVGVGFLDPNNRRFDRGDCIFDRRHIANLTVVAETPRFNNNALRIVATGWRLSGIYRIASGAPLTVTTSIDRQLSGTSNQRPNQLMLDAYGDGSLANFLNPKAFALPALSTLGNMSPFTVRGPNLWGLDIALSRVFAIRERQSLEVRGEAFNLTNSLHPGNPNTVLNQNTFGRILATAPGSAGDPRIMQFAMKYVF
jgi:hypothetical protein